MTAQLKEASRLAGWCAWWTHVLDLALTAWVLRPLVVGMALGFLLLWLVPQAQDLLVEMATDSLGRMLLFFALLVFVWALPTHYASRLLVDTDARYLQRLAARDTAFIKGLKKWAPRVLGASAFVAMIGAVVRSWWNLPTVGLPGYTANVTLHLGVLAALLVVLLIVFLIYAVHRHRLAATAIVQWAEAVAAVPMRLLARFLPAFAALGSRRAGASDLGPFLLLLMFGVFALLPLCAPLVFAEWFPRASSVPFALGGWMPLLVYLAGVGRRLRAPLIAFAFALTGILPLIFGDSYAVRRIDAAETVASLTGRPQPDPRAIASAIGLKEAVLLWQQANNCEGAATACPRPIIVAAAGGASRAGFFTAGVIGQLLDDAIVVDGRRHGLSAAEVNNRLFALSTVSGSSVGAVMTVAALAASPDGRQSCRRGSQALWWGKTIGGWRDCLEALTSGDFLTPVFAGFVFRDTLRFLGFLGWSDRATLLERSWERHFATLIGRRNPDPGGLACVGDLACPFMTLRPLPGRWLPLLVLNGTSVSTGQRIVTTALAWNYEPRDAGHCPLEPRSFPCQLFARGAMFHDLLRGKAAVKLNDVRLSTSADNSARFPLISPPGTILDSADEIVDRIVDGGYFENFGAQTATELAQAIRAIEPGLLPFILVLSNDPQIPRKNLALHRRHGSEGSFMTDISAPIAAFANTRNARGTLAVDAAGAVLDAVTQNACNISHIRVLGEAARDDPSRARALSMSWWLSKPVQIYLHQQTDPGLQSQESNRPAMRDLLDALARDSPRRAPNASGLRCSYE